MVRDTKYYDLRDEFAPEVYVTTAQDDEPDESAGFVDSLESPHGER